MSFAKFAKSVHERYNQLAKHELFETVDGNELWEAYLKAFPAGTDPIYKTETEHTCTCCRAFVKNIGNVVAIVDGMVQSIWDAKDLEYPYDVVARVLNDMVVNAPITNLWRTSEHSYGAETTHQQLEDKSVKQWKHFHGKVGTKFFTQLVDKSRGDYRTTVEVFKRGLEELKIESLNEVVNLIESKALYRGEEHLKAVEGFVSMQHKYAAAADKPTFVWANAASKEARFRNTVIGTLVQDLSAGVDLEDAVRMFESKVAPTNYKRTSALVTPGMVKTALEKVKELGLETALERRYATLADVSVHNVLWADGTAQSKMKDGVEALFDSLAAVKATVGKPVDIAVDEFMSRILPETSTLEVLVEGRHQSNFMSLTAPVHAEVQPLFKWGNNFGWSYDGNITDSIKEKVKVAGGNVTNAKLRVSLAWSNFDDLDLWVKEPNGNHICYHNKSGKLDVDMNAGMGTTRSPVENVSWISVADGNYVVGVNQFTARESIDVGFTVEVESEGKLTQLSYAKALRGNMQVCSFTTKSGKIVSMSVDDALTQKGLSVDKWGVATEQYAKVNTLMLSPNYWDGEGVGNKHWFFVLDKCANPAGTRGIYNEFLRNDLTEQRKVFEVLGAKTMCQPAADQLSGLGFSSTKGDNVVVRVSGGKVFNVTF